MHRLVFTMIAFLSTGSLFAQPYRQRLTSVQHNLSLAEFAIQSESVTPQCRFPWSIKKTVLKGGKQEGSELIAIDNGKFKIVLVPTRGLGILVVRMGDLRLGWDSPVEEIVHPKFINLQSRGGLGWLDGFNEWLCRCGLENNGQAGKDEFINNMGDKAVMDLTLHGRVANIPCQEVEVIVDKEPPFRISVRGLVQERMLFGPKLDLITTVSVVPGSTTFTIADEVVNVGAQPQEFQMLYHFNFGKPLLEEGARVVAAAKDVKPFNANAAKDLNTFDSFRGPTLGYIEQVYLFAPLADKSGRTEVLLHNRAKDRGASLAWNLKELPYLTLWKNTGAEADGYVCGLEPGTNYPNHRSVERKAGRVPVLRGGERYTMTLDVTLLPGATAVAEGVERVRAIGK